MDDRTKELLRIALSGAVTGGIFGAGGKMLSGARNLGSIARSGGIGAGIGSSIAAGSNALGSAVMGDPTADEGSPSSMRGLVGGALAGAAVGGGLGGLGAAGKLAVSRETPAILRNLSKFAKKELPLDNLLVDQIKAWIGQGGSGVAKGAALGAGSLGAIGAMEGADEGATYDAIRRELDEAKKEQLRRQVMEMGYGY